MKPLHLLCLAPVLAACQQTPPPESAAPAAESRGQALARASCGSCHAVERYGLSPNRAAPPFAAIANQPGLTAETLSSWLRDAHNYPRQMEFSLGEREVEELVAYMLTLSDPGYRPPT